MRLFFDCPALKTALSAAAASYPTDPELLRTWRHDSAWDKYKHDLVSDVGRRRPASARTITPAPMDFGALPLFTASRTGQSRVQLDEGSKLYKWASEYLDKHVTRPDAEQAGAESDANRPAFTKLPQHFQNAAGPRGSPRPFAADVGDSNPQQPRPSFRPQRPRR